MKQVYKKRTFVIYRVRDGHIIYNTKKPFSEGHTHVSNYDTAIRIMNIAISKEIPRHLSDYLLESLIRLTDDDNFRIRIENMQKIRKKGKVKEKISKYIGKKFIGTKVITARPISRGEYNELRGWKIPEDENPEDEGYLVKYEDGYITWSPKNVFESSYRAFDGGMDFGHAIDLMKIGFKVARKGWNGKNQYIQLATCISYKTAEGEIVNCEHDAIGNKAIAFVGTSGVQMGWLASQADMLAEDWCVVQ